MKEESGMEKEEEVWETVEGGVLATRHLDDRIRILQTEHDGPGVLPWRFRTDVPRAALFGIHSGIGYLL